MQIDVPFKYTVVGTLHHRRKPHAITAIAEQPLRIDIPEISRADAPLALQLIDPIDDSLHSEMRWYGGRLWKGFAVRREELAPSITTPEEIGEFFHSNNAFRDILELPEADQHYASFDASKYQNVLFNDEAETRDHSIAYLSRYLLIDNRMYIAQSEPTYQVTVEDNPVTDSHIAIYIGFWHKNTAAKTHFRADRFEEAEAYANHLATYIKQAVPVRPSLLIRILIPEAIQFDPTSAT